MEESNRGNFSGFTCAEVKEVKPEKWPRPHEAASKTGTDTLHNARDMGTDTPQAACQSPYLSSPDDVSVPGLRIPTGRAQGPMKCGM